MPPVLPRRFPFRPIFTQFLEEYGRCTTYWYVPHVRTITDDNVRAMQAIVQVMFDDFLGERWDVGTQNTLLEVLRSSDILAPRERKQRFPTEALFSVFGRSSLRCWASSGFRKIKSCS